MDNKVIKGVLNKLEEAENQEFCCSPGVQYLMNIVYENSSLTIGEIDLQQFELEDLIELEQDYERILQKRNSEVRLILHKLDRADATAATQSFV